MEEITEIVTAIVAQKNNPSRCSIYLNDEFAFGCTMDIVLKYRLAKGQILSNEIKREMLNQEHFIKLKQEALQFATYKPRTEKQIVEAMLDRGYTSEESLLAVEFLREFNYLNDANYARMFIADSMIHKPMGERKMREELRKRGVQEFEIDDALANYLPKDSSKDQARQAAEKKLRSLGWKSNDKQKSSLISFLQSRGFSWEIIREVVEELLNKE